MLLLSKPWFSMVNISLPLGELGNSRYLFQDTVSASDSGTRFRERFHEAVSRTCFRERVRLHFQMAFQELISNVGYRPIGYHELTFSRPFCIRIWIEQLMLHCTTKLPGWLAVNVTS